MTFIRLIYSVIALACVVCLWAIFVFPRPSKQLSQRVSITSAYEDLGFVYSGDRRNVTLRVSNPTEKPIEISRFIATCTCTRVEPNSMILSPSETKEVLLTIAFPKDDSPKFSAAVQPVCNSVQLQPFLLIAKKRSAPIEVTPPVIQIREPLTVDECILPIEASIHLISDVKKITPEIDEAIGDVEVVRGFEKHGKDKATVRLSLKPISRRGPFSCGIRLNVECENAPDYSTVIAVEAKVTDGVEVFPESLNLGAMDVGAMQDTVVTFSPNADFLHAEGPSSIEVKSIGKGKARLTAVCSEAGQMHGVVKYWFRIKGKQAIAEQSIAIYGRVTE